PGHQAARGSPHSLTPRARDVFALHVHLDLGVRRDELRSLRVRDVDLARRVLVVFGKGQKARALPMRGEIVLAADSYLLEEVEASAASLSPRTTSSIRRSGRRRTRRPARRPYTRPTRRGRWSARAFTPGVIGCARPPASSRKGSGQG